MGSPLYLCVAFTILLAATSCAQENGRCPRKTTTTHHTPTTHHTTTPKTTAMPTTTHPHTNHTTAHTTATHTTAHTTANHTTANHTSAPHTTAHIITNHTTANHTSAPHTTAHITNHTTASHPSPPYITTHTAAPITTMMPTLSPDIPVGEYTVKNGNDTCLRAKFGLSLMIRYNVTGSSQQVWGAVVVPDSPSTHSNGSCSNQMAVLSLTFPGGFVQFTFSKNVAKQLVYLSDVHLRVNHKFPNCNETSFQAQSSSLSEFETVLGYSYRCKNLTFGVSADVSLNFIEEQVQAFELPGGQFGQADHCPADQPSMAVPIIVGVLLAVLIIIVVVAYLIGRRHPRGGYQSI